MSHQSNKKDKFAWYHCTFLQKRSKPPAVYYNDEENDDVHNFPSTATLPASLIYRRNSSVHRPAPETELMVYR